MTKLGQRSWSMHFSNTVPWKKCAFLIMEPNILIHKGSMKGCKLLHRNPRTGFDECLQISQKVGNYDTNSKVKTPHHQIKLTKGSRRLLNFSYQVLCFVSEPWATSMGNSVQRQEADPHFQRSQNQTRGGIGCICLQLMEFYIAFNVLTVISFFYS